MPRKISSILKRTVVVILIIAMVLTIVTVAYMQKATFGKAPEGARLATIQKSPRYKEGKFQNLSITPELTEGYSMAGVTYTQLFRKAPRRTPIDRIPSIKTNLLSLPADTNVLVWFGHSSYFIQLDGKRILVDPVFSGNASPVPGTVNAFDGTDIYTAAELPPIDYLFLSHDHYDHVDHETLLALKSKVKKVICGLGVGAHFEYWGYPAESIIEKDWYEQIELGDGFTAVSTPARHFSGRTFARNTTLWMSYVLQSPTMKIYIGGDSGYDTHFADIGNRYGPIDLAIIDNGQYDSAWRYVHTLPGEVLMAARDLKARRLFPVHSSKFVLANHPWDEPLVEISKLNEAYHFPLVTPMIGEVVQLNNIKQVFKQWWVGIK
ncbi:MBL fold metallo-hydrolase [Segetibacter sp. 3557_3]|uniref:MBL fold metallo-hydrolase n=1 Tax=Segetibacter sp. 3557_3 TaxID=2547429 RepID=UPI001058D4A7|nr:MBL fold metallo-hydrolase [Segetibacter sp. 3557_3]TDH28579.1 MBL fold metallo-hydrolase [Segetibacter sp. 3557_3]